MTQRTTHPAAQSRAIVAIAAATGCASLSMTTWFPFLPLFMLQIGAEDDAHAVFWVAVGLTTQGITRLLGGPLWGLLSDKLGRKKMFVRALYSAALTTFVLSVIYAPWQVAIALGLQGLLSGFVPAAVALASVSVPDAQVKPALSMVAASQYLGSAIGPAIGAATAIVLGYRGAFVSSGTLVLLVATAVIYLVPADLVHKNTQGRATAEVELEPFKLTRQLALAIFLFFFLFALNTFRTIATPIALKQIAGPDVTAVTGLAFALGGVASALGVWLSEGRLFSTRRMRPLLVAASLFTAAAHLLLALSDSVWLYVLAFTAASLLNASMMPATNALIAFNVSRSRRGAAFGVASAAQAVAFMVGPMGATAFASFSLKLGFAFLGVLLIGLAFLIRYGVREPSVNEPG